ncbi:MAG: hypothetical protein RL205_228 [Actinomycetota bacterium]
MSAARQVPRALIAMGASLALLSACSSTSPGPTVDAGNCTGASPAELTSSGSGEVCADTGFHPSSDGFSFANWGGTPTDDAIDSGTLIAMFGRAPVCTTDSTEACTMRPAAKAWMDQMNEALANGRCEGMAVLSERLFDGLAHAAELDPLARHTVDLARTQPTVARTLGYWWLTQFPTEVATPTSKSRALPPSQMIAQVIAGLENRSGNTLGLYSEFGGHAVTPIAVVKEGSNFTISVYDSNDPGVIKHVVVDPASESWVYDAKTNSSGVVTEHWKGSGAGSMDLTPMALRSGAFTAPFDDGPNGDTYVTVTSPKDGTNPGAIITKGTTVIDTRALDAALPAGVTVHQITGTGAGVEVIIKGDAGAIEVRAVSSRASAMATLSVDAPGKPMITARGRTGSTSSKALTISRSADGTVAVTSGSKEPVRTTISTTTESVHLTAPKSTDVHVTPDDTPAASLVDASGSTLASYDIPGGAPSEITTTTLSLNSQSDGFTVARSLTIAEAPVPAPVVESPTVTAPSPSASTSPTRERKDKQESERGRQSPRPSKSRGDRQGEPSASSSESPSPSPSRSRSPENSRDTSGSASNGHAAEQGNRAPVATASGTPSASASATSSASASASVTGTPSSSASVSASPSASATPTSSASQSASATPSPSRSATPTPTPTPTRAPTPTPSSTKKNDDKNDNSKKQDD